MMNTEEVSISDIIRKMQNVFHFLIRQWWKVLIAGFIGGLAGCVYAYCKPVTYTAKLNFIVEEGKGGAGGGLAALAGQFGFDLGGMSGGAGLLSGDNIMVFLKSKSLARETLLTPYDSAGKTSLADQFAEVTGLNQRWKNSKKVGTLVSFPVSTAEPLSRLQDSLLQVITKMILEKNLVVEKPDKKAAFVEVITEMKDERLAKYFCERLVLKATQRYVNSKTQRQMNNVSKLQRRADSIGALLNNRTFNSAVAQESILDINPGYKTATVNAEVTNRDKIMLSTIYGEVIKNLEIGKVALSQETPTIQVVDSVILPLQVNKQGKMISGLVGAFLVSIMFSLFLSARYLMKY